MENYIDYNTDIYNLIGYNEKIICEIKPHMLTNIFKLIIKLGIVPLIWTIFDSIFFMSFYFSDSIDASFLLFMFLHMIPVWAFIIFFITYGFKLRKAKYIITDSSICVISALGKFPIKYKLETNKFKMQIKRTFFNKIFNTADIIITISNERTPLILRGISDFLEIYDILYKKQI